MLAQPERAEEALSHGVLDGLRMGRWGPGTQWCYDGLVCATDSLVHLLYATPQ
jgi:hypothetical protein